jgi:RecA/RadA recombinase
MAKDYMRKLLALEGAVLEHNDPHSQVISTPSPSVNFVFGKGQGLPLSYSLLLYGPPKGGKSVICNAMVGQLHQDYPDAIAVKFNTEFREKGQLTPQQLKLWGIDQDRYVAYEVNTPDMIYDRIENEIAAMCQDGAPIKLVIIDSINAVQGRRAMNADSVMTQQIGDDAMTNQVGLKRILPIQRKYGFALIVTAHVRSEMDQAEQMRGNKVRPGVAFGVQHHCEYYLFVEPNKTKDGRKDASGVELTDETVTDMKDNADRTGHKIRVSMKDSSLGPKGRSGEFTLDYDHGIINTHEEVFLLGVNRGIIEKINNLSYGLGDRKWTGKPAMLAALKAEPDLQKTILQELKKRDMEGRFDSTEESPSASGE